MLYLNEKALNYLKEDVFIHQRTQQISFVTSLEIVTGRFVVLGLSTKNEPQVLQVVHTGSINSSIVHPRDVMKALILANCASCIISHNHPSNDVKPSPEDIAVTERLVEAGKILGIDVLDHLILATNRYLSLKEKG